MTCITFTLSISDLQLANHMQLKFSQNVPEVLWIKFTSYLVDLGNWSRQNTAVANCMDVILFESMVWYLVFDYKCTLEF